MNNQTPMNTEPEKIEIPIEEIAESIQKLSDGMKVLNSSRLKQETIVLLLHHVTKVRKSDINDILNALPELERTFLKKVL
jgi:hypothetical protein